MYRTNLWHKIRDMQADRWVKRAAGMWFVSSDKARMRSPDRFTGRGYDCRGQLLPHKGRLPQLPPSWTGLVFADLVFADLAFADLVFADLALRLWI